MKDLLKLILGVSASLFKLRAKLEAEAILPVNRDDTLAGLGNAPHEADEPSMEPIRVEQPEDSAERVVARCSGLQYQNLLQ